MKKGRMQDAWRSMKKIRHTEVQAARDLYYAYVQYMEESKVGVIVTSGRNGLTSLPD